MSAKPYTDAEIAERRENPLCVYVMGQEPRLEQNEQRWLATVDALQARLDAALAAPEPAQAGEAVAWAARDGFGKVVVLEPTERKAKAQSVRRALEVGGGPLPVFPLYAAPSRPGGAATPATAAEVRAAAREEEAEREVVAAAVDFATMAAPDAEEWGSIRVMRLGRLVNAVHALRGLRASGPA